MDHSFLPREYRGTEDGESQEVDESGNTAVVYVIRPPVPSHLDGYVFTDIGSVEPASSFGFDDLKKVEDWVGWNEVVQRCWVGVWGQR